MVDTDTTWEVADLTDPAEAAAWVQREMVRLLAVANLPPEVDWSELSAQQREFGTHCMANFLKALRAQNPWGGGSRG